MMYLNSLTKIIGPLIEELEGRQLLSAAPLAMPTASASDAAAALVQPASLAGTFIGTAHVGRAPAGLLGASGVHSIPAKLSMAEDSNGLLTGTLTLGPASGFTAQTFTIQGMVKGHNFDAAIWQGAVGTPATSAGQIRGHINSSGSVVSGSVTARFNGKTDHATFKLAPIASAQASVAAALPSSTTTVENFTGSARLHVPKGFGSAAGITPTSGKTGFSLNVTGQSAGGSESGTLFIQNLGTFDFVGNRTGQAQTLFFNGSLGSGELKGRLAANDVSISGNLFDTFNGQIVTGHFTARNSAAAASASASNSSTTSNTNTLNNDQMNTQVGLGIGGTPIGAGTGTTTANGFGNPGITNNVTTTTTTTNVGTGLGGTPASSAATPLGGSANGTLGGFPVFTGSVGSAGGSIGTPGSGSSLVGSVGSNIGPAGQGTVSDLVGSVGMPGSSSTSVGTVSSAGGSIGTSSSSGTLVGSVGSAGSSPSATGAPAGTTFTG